MPVCQRNYSGMNRFAAQTPKYSEKEKTDFFKELSKCALKAAILSVLQKYCEDFVDPVFPVVLPKSLSDKNWDNLECSRNHNTLCELFPTQSPSQKKAK